MTGVAAARMTGRERSWFVMCAVTEKSMYSYRITVESLGNLALPTAPKGGTATFEIQNHDDLLKIMESVRGKELVDPDKSAALAIGLKLLSEIVLEKRNDPMFVPLLEPLHAFIKRLKTAEAVRDVAAL